MSGGIQREGYALMSIVDPSIIAFLQNYRQAQKGKNCKVPECIGSLLVDSLKRTSLLSPIREPEMVCG